MTGVEVVLMAVLVVWSSFLHKGMARGEQLEIN